MSGRLASEPHVGPVRRAQAAALMAGAAEVVLRYRCAPVQGHQQRLDVPFVALLNAGGEALDRAVPLLREPVPGPVNANYHLEAVA
jgi:hypothetical protein